MLKWLFGGSESRDLVAVEPESPPAKVASEGGEVVKLERKPLPWIDQKLEDAQKLMAAEQALEKAARSRHSRLCMEMDERNECWNPGEYAIK